MVRNCEVMGVKDDIINAASHKHYLRDDTVYNRQITHLNKFYYPGANKKWQRNGQIDSVRKKTHTNTFEFNLSAGMFAHIAISSEYLICGPTQNSTLCLIKFCARCRTSCLQHIFLMLIKLNGNCSSSNVHSTKLALLCKRQQIFFFSPDKLVQIYL